jgi:CRP-like cAMP-binding protein
MYDLILKNIARHVTLSPVEESYFTSLLHHRKLRKRQYLLQAGEVCRYENFVIKGCLRAYNVDDKGEEHIVTFAMEDWWISDMYSLITGTPATLHIDALEDSEVLSIEKKDLENVYLRIPLFERFYRILLQNSLVANQRRVLSAISQTAEEQYLAFIRKYPSLDQRVPQSQIASYLGITPETISRIRKQWVDGKK